MSHSTHSSFSIVLSSSKPRNRCTLVVILLNLSKQTSANTNSNSFRVRSFNPILGRFWLHSPHYFHNPCFIIRTILEFLPDSPNGKLSSVLNVEFLRESYIYCQPKHTPPSSITLFWSFAANHTYYRPCNTNISLIR